MTTPFTFDRLFMSDLRRPGLIPAALLEHPALAAREAERARLAAAEGTGQRHSIVAAENALVQLGDTLRRTGAVLRRTVVAHSAPLLAAAQARVQRQREEAAELLRQAQTAAAKAQAAEQLTTWLRRCAAAEVPTRRAPRRPEPQHRRFRGGSRRCCPAACARCRGSLPLLLLPAHAAASTPPGSVREHRRPRGGACCRSTLIYRQQACGCGAAASAKHRAA